MDSILIDSIVKEVLKRINNESLIEVESSGRHVHLSRKDVELLFGEGYKLTPAKELSQPGQFACEERVTITGPKGSIKNVVILGPERKATQVEISLTDALSLGIKAPIRESGKIDNTPGITISSSKASIIMDKGVIVAKRHIHITPEDALKYGVKDSQIVKVEVLGERPLIFDDTIIRVSPQYRTYMHIDYDEANACGYKKGVFCKILNDNNNKLQKTNSDNFNNANQIEIKGKKAITEADIKKSYLSGIKTITISKESMITPLAVDFIRINNIKIIRN
ncbi:MAG TPA: propanediol utilization protein [Clostridiales bacterium]|nr:propanediol utilization protein [Clostridiales bacterium]